MGRMKDQCSDFAGKAAHDRREEQWRRRPKTSPACPALRQKRVEHARLRRARRYTLQDFRNTFEWAALDVAAPSETFDPGPILLPAFSVSGHYWDNPGNGNIPIDDLDGLSAAYFVQIPAQPIA